MEGNNMIMMKILQTLQLQHEGPSQGDILELLHRHDVALVVDCLNVHLLGVITQTKAVQRVLTGVSQAVFATKSR